MASRATLALKSAENLRRSLFISTSKLLLIRLSRKSGVLHKVWAHKWLTQ
jgi:hypothetical protein